MTRAELDALVHTLALLVAAYEPQIEPLDLDKVDDVSYRLGFRNGARSAYADAVCRLRQLSVDDAKVTRIGAAS